MGDLEAELARFEAELAAGPRAPPTLPPPGMPAPQHNESARAAALNISGEEAFRRRAMLSGGGGGGGGPPPPLAPPPRPMHLGPPPPGGHMMGPPPGMMMGGPMGGPPPPGMMMGGPMGAPPQLMPPPQPYGAGPGPSMYGQPPTMYAQPPINIPPPQQQMDPAAAQAAGQAAIAQGLAAAGKKNKGVSKVALVRQAAGERWVDPTLLEWPENDFRIFVGNLGNEVTDAVLTAAFSKYTSFQKAKVVRSSHNNKTKGYGFVSLGDNEEGARALREMQGKYIGNRPCQVKRSNWDERSVVDKSGKPKKRSVTVKEKPAPNKRPATGAGILHR